MLPGAVSPFSYLSFVSHLSGKYSPEFIDLMLLPVKVPNRHLLSGGRNHESLRQVDFKGIHSRNL